MFANLTYDDKVAFFELLDEYFESRPHNRPGGGSSAPASAAPPARSSTHTNIAIPNTAISAAGNAARNHLMSQIRGPPANDPAPGAPARSPVSPPAASSNAPAWQAAGKGLMGKAGSFASEFRSAPSNGKGPPPAPPGRVARNAGASGLTSSKTFGHVSTDSKLGFAKTLFNDPQKQPAPYEEAPRATPSYRQSSGLPPPPTRTVSAQPPTPEAEEQEDESGSFAEALYAFTSNEEGDLPVREKEVVVIVAKTSDDWWTCRNRQTGREGLVPSAYMKEI